MAEQPQETEGIVKGGKKEPVAEDDQFPPEGAQGSADAAIPEGGEDAENPRRGRLP